jgi:hypothetical protein
MLTTSGDWCRASVDLLEDISPGFLVVEQFRWRGTELAFTPAVTRAGPTGGADSPWLDEGTPHVSKSPTVDYLDAIAITTRRVTYIDS